MTRSTLSAVLLGAVVLQGWAAHAGETATAADAGTETSPGGDVRDVSLEALLDTSIQTATLGARPTRETPGVVEVVTREEILASGARDLLEVLQLVPGFSFHVDVEGTIGIGFRGMWGHEGKVLLLIDGQEMNESLYSTLQFGNTQLVHNIERVEVIRGPGSAIYGGYAELAVIQIITRGAKEIRGIEAALRYTQMRRNFADWSVAVGAGYTFESLGGLEASFTGYIGQGNRSNGTYTDFSGNSYDMLASSQSDPLHLNLGLKWKGFKLRVLYDSNKEGAQDGYGTVLPEPGFITFRTLASELSYEAKLGDTFTIKPRLNFRLQQPWQNTDVGSPLYYDKTSTRLLAGVTLLWEPTETIDVLGGVEGNWDHGALNNQTIAGAQTLFGSRAQVDYANVAAFLQALWDNPIANVAVGGRLEYHSQYGLNFAPRLGLTRKFDRLHFKLLYGGAFRSPGLENINLGQNVVPEQTQVGEFEVGLQATDFLYGAANVFYTNIQRPIVYAYDATTDTESYRNFGTVAAAGFEIELAMRGRFGFLRASYSTYFPTENAVPAYQVPGDTSQFLAMPVHKVTLQGKWRIYKGLGLGGSGIFFSERKGYLTPTDALDGTGQLGTQPAALVVNLVAGYEGLGLQGLDVQVGVNNLFGADVPYLQPYDGGHAPLPGRPREFFARISYTLHLQD